MLTSTGGFLKAKANLEVKGLPAYPQAFGVPGMCGKCPDLWARTFLTHDKSLTTPGDSEVQAPQTYSKKPNAP